MASVHALKTQPESEPASTLHASSGAQARVVEREGVEHIQVCNPQGQLVFEYDPASGRTTVSIPVGDLALETPRGSIEMRAAEGVRFQSAGPVELDSATAVSLGVAGAGAASSRLLLGSEGARLRAPSLGVETRRASVAADELSYRGRKLRARLESALLVADRVETVAQRIVERAKNVYRRVEGLHQLRAGRSRTHVEGSHVLHAERSRIHARGPLKLDGERIHLG